MFGNIVTQVAQELHHIAPMAASVGESSALPTTSTASITEIVSVIKECVSGILSIASSGFDFLLSTPLSAFMIGSGFAFTSLGLVRKALRTAKRT